MSDEVFNIFSAIGIGLTFLASIAAVIVSVISLRYSLLILKFLAINAASSPIMIP